MSHFCWFMPWVILLVIAYRVNCHDESEVAWCCQRHWYFHNCITNWNGKKKWKLYWKKMKRYCMINHIMYHIFMCKMKTCNSVPFISFNCKCRYMHFSLRSCTVPIMVHRNVFRWILCARNSSCIFFFNLFPGISLTRKVLVMSQRRSSGPEGTQRVRERVFQGEWRGLMGY